MAPANNIDGLPAHQTSVLLNDDQRLNWLRLIRTRNVGPATFWRLLNHFGGAKQALDALPEYAQRGGGKKLVPVTQAMVERELAAAKKFGAKLVARGEAGYPPFLSELETPPPLLYIKGNPALAAQKSVALVGSRNASALGQKFTRRLAGELARKGYCIVSGLARGIDTAAHMGALDVATIAVIAGGIDNYYPPQNRELQQKIEQSGLVISESPPGLEPLARDFPRRNRIISGSTLGTVVVEANLRSGSLITARLANEQGRHVMAVPGHPLDPRAAGPNRLIRNGASLINGAEDVIEDLSPMSPLSLTTSPDQISLFETIEERNEMDFVEIEQSDRSRILDALGPHSVEIDELVRATELPSRIVQAILLELELAGKVRNDGAQKVHLVA